MKDGGYSAVRIGVAVKYAYLEPGLPLNWKRYYLEQALMSAGFSRSEAQKAAAEVAPFDPRAFMENVASSGLLKIKGGAKARW